MDSISQTLIASAFGVLVTLAVQWFGTRSKVRHESLTLYAEKLASVRIKAYPLLYSILSEALKHIDFEKLHSEELSYGELEREINEWDSKYGYLLGEMSGGRAWYLRRVIRALIEGRALSCALVQDRRRGMIASLGQLAKRKLHLYEETKRVPIKDDLRYALAELEIGLRVDLKVYSLEYFTVRRGFRGHHPTLWIDERESGRE